MRVALPAAQALGMAVRLTGGAWEWSCTNSSLDARLSMLTAQRYAT